MSRRGDSDLAGDKPPPYGIHVTFAPSEALAEELKGHVAQHMGPIVRPEKITFVDALPKTRSGKIMRRVLKARAQGLPEGDVSTLEE